MIFPVLDEVIGTSTKVRLLRVMVTLTRSVSGREAARLAGVSSRAISSLDELASTGVLIKEQATSQFLYSFNRSNILSDHLAALFQAEERRTHELLAALAELLSAASIEGAAIFGSVARHEAKPRSDLDLLVVVSDRSDEQRVYESVLDSSKSMWERFGVRLSPVVIKKSRWLRQIREHDAFAVAVLHDAIEITGSLFRQEFA